MALVANRNLGKRLLGSLALLLVALTSGGCDAKSLVGVEVNGGGFYDCCLHPVPWFDARAYAVYSDGEVKDVTTYAQWTSSEESIATVSPGGLVLRVSTGQVVVRATIDGVTGAITLDVP